MKFTIAIPAYKSRFLHECIDSILRQTVPDFELIILNDCSPEPVRHIVSQFEDPRILYYENPENRGALRLVENWNTCLSLANGEYIMIMGDDDRLEPDFLEAFSLLIDQHPLLDVYHCRSKIIDEAGNVLICTPSCPEFERVYDHIWHRLRQLRSQYISDFVYRVSALREQGGFFDLPLAWGSDDITAYIAAKDKGIAHTNKPVFNYRSNNLSITSTGNDLKKMEANEEYASWLADFLKTTPHHPEDAVFHQHLLLSQQLYMKQRKQYTMSLSMRTNTWSKAVMWLKNRKRFGLTVRDIFISALKGKNMREK